MATDEAYMPSRDRDESQRLDTQHHFCRALAHGHLVQPSIPDSSLRDIADVGCGTGTLASRSSPGAGNAEWSRKVYSL